MRRNRCGMRASIAAAAIAAAVAAAMLLLSVLPGCSLESRAQTNPSPTSSADPSQATTGGKVTLKLLIDTNTTLDGVKAVAKLMEMRLGIATEFEFRPGGSEGDNLVKTRLATGDMADLLYYNSGSLFAALNPEQYFVDLTKQPFMASISDSFKSTVSINGKVFGIPGRSTTAGAWLYNKKVYAALGLTVPTTWSELMANNERIKAAGKIPIIASFKDTWTSQLIVLADYYNVMAKEPNFAANYTANKAKIATTPAALRSFEKLEEVYKKGFLSHNANATTYDTALQMLVSGAGVHYPMLTFALTAINDKYPDKINDIGVFAQPGDSADDNGLTVWMPSAFYINKMSKHVDAAKKWFEFFISAEGQAAFAAKSKPEGPYVLKSIKLPADTYTGVKDMLPYFEAGNTAPALEFLSPVKGPNLEQITVEVGSGIKSAIDGAKMYDKDVEKQAKQLNLPGW